MKLLLTSRRSSVGRTLGAGALTLSAVLAGGCSCFYSLIFPSYRDQFIDTNYGVPSDKPSPKIFDPTVIEPLRVHATITPLLVSGYDDPNAAAACIRGYGAPNKIAALRAFGACLAKSDDPPGAATCLGSNATRWDRCMTVAFEDLSCHCEPSVGCSGDALSCKFAATTLPAACAALGPDDTFRVTTAVAQAGEAMMTYELQNLGPARAEGEASVLARPLSPALAALFHDAFEDASDTLACDATNGAKDCLSSTTAVARKTRADAPVLALSGGAASGAYTAGFVYELLQARKAARTTNASAANEKFSAVVGNSVGSLIAPMVELALTDDPVPATSLEWCRKQLDPMPAQAPASASECGLALMERYLTDVNEWDLLCVEDANFVEFLNAPSDPNDLGRPSFGRFWPLERDIAKPFYEHFDQALLHNGVTRVVMTSDTQSKTMQGLDERVCRTATLPTDPAAKSCSAGAAGSTLSCLPCGVLASIPNPLFARAPRRAWTGVRREGEAGTFFDGGLRSTFPILRAVELSGIGSDLGKATPVLALSTERSESKPDPAPRTGIELALRSIDSLTHETSHWELAYATLFEEQRRHRAALPRLATLGVPVCIRGTASPSAPFGGVFAMFMPAKLEPERLSAAEYQFDPIVMRGLFIAGRRSFLDAATDRDRNVLGFLRWNMTKTEVTRPDANGKSWLDLRRAKLEREYQTWLKHFPMTQTDWDAHTLERRSMMQTKLETCPE